jgi:rifampicin phosphotransferase
MASVEGEVTATFPEDWHANVPPGPPLEFDREHFPFPVSPLFSSTMGPAFAAGATAAFRALDLPMHDFVVVERNHYLFYRWATLAAAGPDDGAGADQVPASVKSEIGRMMERWQREHLPRILDHLCRLEALDVASATPTEIGLRLDEAQAIHEDLWRIHFIVVEPAMYSLEQFDELFAGLFGNGTPGSHDLLVGGLSETLKAGIGLSDLAAQARDLGLAGLLLETPLDGLVGALEGSEAGRVLLDSLGTYLDAYGLRQDYFEYAAPTWREDPSTALASIRNYLHSGFDARIEQEAIARSAEAALNAAREQLAGYPAPVRSKFEAMVQFGRDGAFLHEEHNYFIDQRGMALLRLFYLKVGQRFVDVGSLNAADDVFMLDIGELQRALDGLSGADASGSLRRLVAERRAELESAATMSPPAFLGEPTASSPAEGESPEPAEELTELRGMGGAKGIVTGIARVARTLDEARNVQPGEILVTITTLPPWTPLFGVVAAVVTETGGPLSHCAIAAREYGIPAVVAMVGATKRIATGQRITVDGATGIVTVLS